MKIQNDILYITVKMPTDGDKEITKNNKYIPLGGGRKMTKPALREWYDEASLLGFSSNKLMEEWKTRLQCELYRVWIFWSLKSYRTDAHNFNELLMDWLEQVVGINDRYFLPSIMGKEKNKIATVAHIAIEGASETSKKNFVDTVNFPCNLL